MSKKPCIQCGNDCEILPVQLGDVFTLAYLRVCDAECMFLMAYDYLYEIGYHKTFRGSLYDKQDSEDKAERDAWVKKITEESLRMLRESLEANPKLLSTPAPEGMLKIFEGVTPIPHCSSQTMRFTRPSKEERVRWAREHFERVKAKLKDATEELERLESE